MLRGTGEAQQPRALSGRKLAAIALRLELGEDRREAGGIAGILRVAGVGVLPLRYMRT